MTRPSAQETPSAMDAFAEIASDLTGRRRILFLDFDGTLTPIVDRPELALLPPETRDTLRKLSRDTVIVIVSGRARRDVEALVGLEGLIYAGSHGFDIAGPSHRPIAYQRGGEQLPALRQAAEELRRRLGGIDGAIVEMKTYAVAVHYRLVADANLAAVEQAVEAAARRHPGLRKTTGKKILELRPAIDWDKGKAVLWLLDALGFDARDAPPLYIGDDVTDEDAFAALDGRGIAILVASTPQPTRARFRLRDPAEVQCFLARLASRGPTPS